MGTYARETVAVSLQEVLARSLEGATPFTRELFGPSLSATAVADLVNRAHEITAATVSETGTPHAALVIAGCVDDVIVFTVSAGSVLHRNLQRSGKLALTCSDRPFGLVGQGTAEPVGLFSELPMMQRHFGDRLTGYDGWIFSFQPRRLFASLG